ncbi:hypothetical protein KA405_02795 [Patescibacteria group bacterium]|nr:hypothetical protein [Patescibacteria group bacterium]
MFVLRYLLFQFLPFSDAPILLFVQDEFLLSAFITLFGQNAETRRLDRYSLMSQTARPGSLIVVQNKHLL